MSAATRRLLVCLGLVCLPFVSCRRDDASEDSSQSQATREEVADLAEGANQFALELYSQLASAENSKSQNLKSQPGNLFFSPYSISSALAMASLGARGETADEMRDVLHLDLPIERVGPTFGEIITSEEDGRHGGYELDSANRLWGQKGFHIKPPFLEATRDYFGAEMTTVDFAQPDSACAAINSWVADQTHGKIAHLIGPESVSGDSTKLVLTSVIYFLGNWAEEFKKANTKVEPFHSPSGDLQVPMMHRTDEYRYAEDDNAQILHIPYSGNDLSMLILLPKSPAQMNSLEESLTHTTLQNWLIESREQSVSVSIPRFKLTAEFQLAETLKALGLKLPFDEKGADFSGIADEKPLFLAQVTHKAYIDVNEKGTEAAAATGIGVKSEKLPVGPKVFRADHPFVFLIYDHRHDNILFVGRLMRPTTTVKSTGKKK